MTGNVVAVLVSASRKGGIPARSCISYYYNGALLVLINLLLICDSLQDREGVKSTSVTVPDSDSILDISMPDVRPTQVRSPNIIKNCTIKNIWSESVEWFI